MEITSITTEPIFFVAIAVIVLVIGAGIAGFFILRKKKNSAAAPPQGDGQPISPAPAVLPPAAEPVLKCVGGTLNGKSYPISDVLCIGTNAAFCSVLYPEGEPGICGIHCKISPSNGQAQLVDADSGGTFINGVPILPNAPYSMPVGSSFTVGSPKNIFIIAENTPSAQQPAPLAVTGNPPPAKKRFPWIAVVSAVAVIAAAVFVVFFLNKEKPTMTINGNNVPVALTEFIRFTDYEVGYAAAYGAAFAGKTDDEVFMLEMRFPEELKSNTAINDQRMFLTVSGKVWGAWYDSLITEYTLEIGQFVPDEYIEITVSAKTEINGKTYNIKADGKLNFDGYDEILQKTVDWFKENEHITTPG